MSFELGGQTDLARETRANAWTIDDVVTRLPVAVVALPPRSRSKAYDHAADLFYSLGAEVVAEPDVPDWADDVARGLYGELVSGR